MKTNEIQDGTEVENYGEPIGIRLHGSVIKELDAIKRKRHTNRNQLIRMAVDALIEHEKLTGNILTADEMRKMIRRWRGESED